MKRIIARVWKLIRGPLQWRILWFANAKFMIGVTGVVRNERCQVLLLKHRMWPADRPWGLPTGYAVKSEEFPMTVVREVREETGLEVVPGRLVQVTSGYRLRAEIAYEALHVGGTLKLDGFEILEAKWFDPDALPEGMQESHVQLIKTDGAPT
ncbi:NUDIX domain-containing protein [Streptomyces sp. SID8366]|uniref:NUDIX domain-containing protein n=1 Tax=unclassified Streptomyces TaxID=2593676 RepID=UPI000DBACF19|nr:NUDIX domain-containing protein [Streptomyces sp. PsTaAH-130]MYU04268.1 NUDIX domain-containing protein [Streptomyces sp. SID8366]MYU61482.1 NUDIX domain-containing protein [Streptomyces sp. SID69]RAJ49862.1 ADP-ribose pyrophosphatase YjhB (NUDIX family) [Streptomyces sp. PsTaAH-130]